MAAPRATAPSPLLRLRRLRASNLAGGSASQTAPVSAHLRCAEAIVPTGCRPVLALERLQESLQRRSFHLELGQPTEVFGARRLLRQPTAAGRYSQGLQCARLLSIRAEKYLFQHLIRACPVFSQETAYAAALSRMAGHRNGRTPHEGENAWILQRNGPSVWAPRS
jgi:hypothetical protein